MTSVAVPVRTPPRPSALITKNESPVSTTTAVATQNDSPNITASVPLRTNVKVRFEPNQSQKTSLALPCRSASGMGSMPWVSTWKTWSEATGRAVVADAPGRPAGAGTAESERGRVTGPPLRESAAGWEPGMKRGSELDRKLECRSRTLNATQGALRQGKMSRLRGEYHQNLTAV